MIILLALFAGLATAWADLEFKINPHEKKKGCLQIVVENTEIERIEIGGYRSLPARLKPGDIDPTEGLDQKKGAEYGATDEGKKFFTGGTLKHNLVWEDGKRKSKVSFILCGFKDPTTAEGKKQGFRIWAKDKSGSKKEGYGSQELSAKTDNSGKTQMEPLFYRRWFRDTVLFQIESSHPTPVEAEVTFPADNPFGEPFHGLVQIGQPLLTPRVTRGQGGTFPYTVSVSEVGGPLLSETEAYIQVLPPTGANTYWRTGAGLLALVGGVALVVLRRREHKTTSP